MTELGLIDGRDFDRAARKLVADLLAVHPDRDAITAAADRSGASLRLTYAPPDHLALILAQDGLPPLALVGVDATGDLAEWIAAVVGRFPDVPTEPLN